MRRKTGEHLAQPNLSSVLRRVARERFFVTKFGFQLYVSQHRRLGVTNTFRCVYVTKSGFHSYTLYQPYIVDGYVLAHFVRANYFLQRYSMLIYIRAATLTK